MNERLFPAREAIVWTLCFLTVAAVLVWTGFTSSDPDSGLYAGLADRLAAQPLNRWLAPEWWGFWPEAHMTGLFREHPAGVLLLPAALTKIGIPAAQGAYIVGAGAGLASLLLMAALIRRFASRVDARVALVLLQLMPVAFIFRIRANHEYPMLVCLLIALHGLVFASTGRLWAAIILVGLGLSGGLIIKGVFVAKILLAIAVWIALKPMDTRGARWRGTVAAIAGVLVMGAVALAYDEAYRAATSEPFWSLYWQRQLGPLTDVGKFDVIFTFARNVLFYLSRIVWHPAPWSIALVLAGWRMRGHFTERWRAIPEPGRKGLLFALSFAGLAMLLVSPASRYAERYAFPSTHAVACAGVVSVSQVWPSITAAIARLDRRIPALPALVWLALALLRLGAGSLLPRIS
jgi:4-amino-4-deoxy-L-arabinose transferase-like glycosyltransferase